MSPLLAFRYLQLKILLDDMKEVVEILFAEFAYIIGCCCDSMNICLRLGRYAMPQAFCQFGHRSLIRFVGHHHLAQSTNLIVTCIHFFSSYGIAVPKSSIMKSQAPSHIYVTQ